MNKDEKKKLDDEFKKNVIESLPDYIPDENKINIADIASDVCDLLYGRQTNNTIVALNVLGRYYMNSLMGRVLSSSEVGDIEEHAKDMSETIH